METSRRPREWRGIPPAVERCSFIGLGGRLLVYRYGLQRGELLRAPYLFPRRVRSIQVTEDDSESGNRPRGVGEFQYDHSN